jgi:hypothetical protein
MEKIFDEFVQLGKTQLTEGTGLGLPISRRLAEMLQGTLEVESQLGVGSTFRLKLPATADSPSSTRTTKSVELGAINALDEQPPSGMARESASSPASR